MRPVIVLALLIIAAVDGLLFWWGMRGPAFALFVASILILVDEA